MVSRRIVAAAALLCALVAPAHAQKTKAQIAAEIGTLFSDNTTGAITPQKLRAVTLDTINSIMPTAPVAAGNLACFSGTTGLLQDCGLPPNTITIGTTVVSAGTFGGLLYNANGFLGNTAALTANQILVGATGSAPVPTSASTWFDNAYCNTVGYILVRFASAWTCSNSLPLPVTWFNAVADSGATDNGPFLRAAYDFAAANGITSIYIPPSNNYFGVSTCRNNAVFDGTSITVPNGNKSVSIIGVGWNLKPFATPQGSWLLPNSSFPSTCSWIRVAGSGAVTGVTYRDFGIGEFGGALGTPKGLHGIFVDGTDPAFSLDRLTIDHVFIANMATGYSIKSAGNNATPFAGAVTNSVIQNSSLMNISAPFFGDGNRIEGNVIGGNATIDSRNVGIQFSNIPGGTSTIIAKNNILNFNGKIVVDGAIKCVIRDNELEQQAGTTNTNGSVVDLNGSTAVVENCSVTGNSISQNSAVGNYKPVNVGNATQTMIYDNRIVLGAAVPYDYVSVNVGLAQGTYIGPNRCAYNGVTTDFSCAVSALGVNGFQHTPFGFILAGTSSQTVVKTTGTGNGTLNIPTPTSPSTDTFALLGAAQTLTTKTISGASNTLTNIGNSSLTNSSTTVNGQTCTLGSTCTITAAATSATVGTTTVASGTSHGVLTNNAGVLGNTAAGGNGQLFLGVTSAEPAFATMSGDATITSAGALALASIASAGTTGSSTAIPVVTINAKGLTTGVTTAAVVAPAGTLTGATLASGVTASSLTSVGTLTGGATGAGFTIALGTSTLTGILPAAQQPAHTGDVTNTAGSLALTLVAGNAGNLNSGTLLAARMPALTGDCTSSAGAVALNCTKINGVDQTTAWTTYTPTVTAQTGTPTTVTATGRSKQIGKTIHAEMDVTVTTVGTAAAAMNVTLPLTAAAFKYVGSAFEYTATGKSGAGFVKGDTAPTVIQVLNADGTTMWASGRGVAISITYEIP